MCLRDAKGHFLMAKIARYNGVPLTNEVKDCGLKKALFALVKWICEMSQIN